MYEVGLMGIGYDGRVEMADPSSSFACFVDSHGLNYPAKYLPGNKTKTENECGRLCGINPRRTAAEFSASVNTNVEVPASRG